MSNRGYCRFQNTLPDLMDCEEHIGDSDLSPDEERARDALIKVCKDIAEDFED